MLSRLSPNVRNLRRNLSCYTAKEDSGVTGTRMRLGTFTLVLPI
jgi:hypothetical protein